MSVMSLNAQQFAGTWSGKADLGGTSLRLVFHLAEDGGTMDSPDQGATGIPITTATHTGDTLRLEIAPLRFSYTGILKGDTIEGKFTQNGATFPLELTVATVGSLERYATAMPGGVVTASRTM